MKFARIGGCWGQDAAGGWGQQAVLALSRVGLAGAAGLAEWLAAGWEPGARVQRGVGDGVLRTSSQQVGGL